MTGQEYKVRLMDKAYRVLSVLAANGGHKEAYDLLDLINELQNFTVINREALKTNVKVTTNNQNYNEILAAFDFKVSLRVSGILLDGELDGYLKDKLTFYIEELTTPKRTEERE